MNRVKFYNHNIRIKMMQLQLLLLFFPGVQLLSFSTENGTIPGSLCYFYSIIFIPFLVIHLKDLIIPKWYIIGLPIFAVVNSICHMGQYGIAKGVLHWIFGGYLLLVVVNVGFDFSKEEWRVLLERSACVFVVAHLLLQIVNYDTIIWLLRGYFDGSLDGWCGCYLPSITRGGRNLDCSWMALFGLFVEGKKKKWYQGYVFGFSMLACSRSGIIVSIILIIYNIWSDSKKRSGKNKIAKYMGIGAIWVLVLLGTGILQANINRSSMYLASPRDVLEDFFPNIEFGEKVYTPSTQEQESVVSDEESGEEKRDAIETVLSGRKAIWEKVPKMFADNPWGYGAGNAMVIMKSDYGFDSFEDVVHNVFMQWLLDEGIVGGIWYIGLLCAFLLKQWENVRNKVFTPYDMFFVGYFVLSLVQFHGAEALMFLVLGIYLLELGQTRKLR